MTDGVLASEELFVGDVPAARHGPEASGEAAMWLAVIARVWEDAFVSSDVWIINSDRGADPALVRSSARRWLLLNHGDWREDRETVCASAGVDPDVVRRAAQRRNELAGVEDQERNRRERESIDTAMATLVARSPSLDRVRVTRELRTLAMREANIY